MTETKYLQFEGLGSPVALENAAELLPMIDDVLRQWPHHSTKTAHAPPFVTIKPSDGKNWSLELPETQSAKRKWNDVNAVCDLVAEMAWERIRTEPDLLCLHAAAVEFAGRLVIFPNVRRAGKSTLTAALARLGHRIYTDDFLPVRFDEASQTFEGIANGVLPRIRLPLPDSFSDSFHAWVNDDPGPSNRQYKYLQSAPVAPGPETMPLGAMVMLDRRDDPITPLLTSIPREDALTNLITQNFARTQLSSAILTSMDALSRHMPVFRLTYHCGEEAAAFLAAHPELKALPAATAGNVSHKAASAPLEKRGEPAPSFERASRYVQANGLTEMQVGPDHFLTDGDGLSIYRLNAGSVAIWRLLAEPTDLDEVIDVLSTAFHNVAPSQIAADSEDLMRNLAVARLIVPHNLEKGP